MRNGHVVSQIYIHLVAFALFAFSVVGLYGYLFIDPASRLKVQSLSDVAVAGLLIAAGLLSAAHNRHRLGALFAGLLLGLCVYTLVHNLAVPSLERGTSWATGLLRMRSPLAVLLGLVAIAMTAAHRGLPGKYVAQCCGAGLLVVIVVTHVSGWLPGLGIEQIGYRIELNYIVHLFLLFIGGALMLLPRLPDNRSLLMDRLTVAAGVCGTFITVITWFLLSQQHRVNQDPADSFAVTYLPNLILILGLIFSFLIMTSQRLARLALKHAEHLVLANHALQASLREQASLQALNQRIVEFSEDILCALDEHLRFTQLSPSTLIVLGYRPEEMLGQSIFDYLLAEDRVPTEATLQAMIDSGERHHFRCSFRREDGLVVHLHWTGRWSANERTLFAMAHDVTPLAGSESFYRSLFTFNPDPVFSFDLEGRFTSVNQAGCALADYSEAELLGEHLSMLVHNEDPSKLADYISTAITGGSLRADGMLRSRSGQLIEVGLTHLPIIIDEKVVGGFGIAKDFSERNRTLRALREALQHSEHQAELLGGLSETAVNINSIINSHTKNDTLLDYMAERLRLLLGAHQSVIQLSATAQGTPAIYSTSLSSKYSDWPDDQLISHEPEFSAKIRDSNQPILLTRDELDNHSRWYNKGAMASAAPAKCGWLAVPLKDHDGTNLGLLQLSDKYEGDFDQDDLAIAQQFAQMAVAVMKNSQLVQVVLAGERRLKTQLEFTSAITNSVSEGLLAVDRQGLLTFINPTAASLLNQRAEQLLGQALAQYLPLALSDSEHSARTSSYHGEVSCGVAPGERYLAFDSAPLINDEGPQGWVVALRDISEQKRFESELAYNASHDVLTGLPNRALLEDRLVQGCTFSRRYKRSLAVMFIDLDGFKPINDSLGHSVGDLILIEVARRMELQVRPGDTVARMGGDEFVIILPDLAKDEDVLLVANRLIENIARVYTIDGTELQVTASMGITLSDGRIEQPMHLIQQADLAMYKAKQQGKNNFQWYTGDLNQKVSERVYLRNELQKAIEAQSLQLYYQPQVDARSGRVTGYEALMRWQHAERGFIPPIQFIPVAEDTGQIIPMSE